MNVSWQKEESSLKLPPTNPFRLKINGKGDGVNKQSSVAADNSGPPTTTVTSSLTNTTNKEMINTTQAIFEALSRTTQDTYLVAVMEKLSDV